MILEKLQSWLVRQRDQTNVTYSRFGRGGDDSEERPPPTTVLVAPFNENAPEFMFLQCWHIQKVYSCFGMSMVVLFFISSFFEFNWYHHRRGVDITALLGLFVYLALGVMIHYYVILGIKKQNPNFLLPFIVVYSVVCTGELVTMLALLFKALEPAEPAQPPFAAIFVVVVLFSSVQLTMLFVVTRCQHYLSMKQMHEVELKKMENPGIKIEFADRYLENISTSNTEENNGTDTRIGIMAHQVI